jgi:hypothetical protein
MPATVSARLKERMTEAKRQLNVGVYDAKLFQFDIIYTDEERKAFGIEQNATFVIVAQDSLAFEALIPERKDGKLNYLRLKNDAAIAKIEDHLSNMNNAESRP